MARRGSYDRRLRGAVSDALLAAGHCLVRAERRRCSGLPPRGLSTPGQGQGDGARRRQVPQSGTQETVGGAGASIVSGVLEEANLLTASGAKALLRAPGVERDGAYACKTLGLRYRLEYAESVAREPRGRYGAEPRQNRAGWSIRLKGLK